MSVASSVCRTYRQTRRYAYVALNATKTDRLAGSKTVRHSSSAAIHSPIIPYNSITLCSKKTSDHIFDDKLKQNYPFTKIFGTLITKSIRHRQVYLVSHLSYFVHLLYLGKLSRPKYHEFSLRFLIFSMLQY